MSEQFATSKQVLDRRIRVATTPNFRDLGGLPVAGGIVPRGQVFRSSALANLDEADSEIVTGLGITSVYDLRTAGERDAQPDRLPTGAQLHILDVLADSKTSMAAAISKLQSNPEVINEVLGGGAAERMLEESYRDFIRLPSAISAYREFFLSLANTERTGAALFHCTAGKDRTGWAAASLLMLLGANDETVHSDYLETNDDYLPALEPMIQGAAKKGVDPDLLRIALGVRLSYLEAAISQVEESYSSIEDYFATGLGLESSTIDALRQRFVE